MAIVVVSDTSPIRALAHLGCLDWLKSLFDEVIIPPAVAEELKHPPNPLQSVSVAQTAFLRVITPGDPARVIQYCQSLDQGEAEAMALAEQLHADLMLIDELVGRQTATDAGFRVLGTLGIILQAKGQGWCTAIEPLLDQLQQELRFFIAPGLRQAILAQAGELAPPSAPDE